MYTGNGVTKKFPIPSGYDGSTVYLIFPTGQNIKMVQREYYFFCSNPGRSRREF